MAKLPEGEIRWPKKVATAADAVGYCLKVSIKNLPLPSLYYTVARLRERANQRGCAPDLGNARAARPAGDGFHLAGVTQLERRLFVVHFGTEQETAVWASGRFELTCRAFPSETAQAQEISPESARARIAAKYRQWHPDAALGQLARLFGWTKAEAIAAINSLSSRR